MKKLLLLLTVCICSLAYGQSNSKMDMYLAMKLQNYSQHKTDANLMLPMLIQGNINHIKQLVNQSGGVFKYSYGNIAAIIIPVNALPLFNESVAVTRMEGAPPHNRPLDDSSNVKNHITEVLQGTSLPQAYTGKGVVIGFVDTGIELKHADFRDSSGTRVQYLWDMNLGLGLYTPLPWGYGQAFNKKQIDLLMTLPPYLPDSAHCNDFGHGSNVAGAACGNAKCDTQEWGGCPKSDIIMVAYDFNNQTATMFTDAVQYIFQCADSLNEPCVVNASMGTYDGSHDDSDLQGEMIDSMLAAKQPGRVLVASAGNGGTPYHVHDSLTGPTDTTFTWFKYDPSCGIVDIPIFANERDFNSIKFRLRVDKVQTGSYTERDTMKTYYNISKYLGTGTFSVYSKSGNRLGVVTYNGGTYGKGSYSLEFTVSPVDSNTYYWGFEAVGTGRFDIWDLCTYNEVEDTVGAGLNLSQTKYPEMKHYKQPDTLMTICSSYQCSLHVITVQTYFNRLGYTDCTGAHQQNPNPIDVPGGFNYGTSRGPVRNFTMMKPDVSAAGNYTLSAVPLCYSVQCNSGTDALGCHNIDGGTSMASPMAASAVGLYLQKYPHATDSNIRRCIMETTYNDKFTGTVSYVNESYNWGAGKLHTLDFLKDCGPIGSDIIPVIKKNYKLSAFPNPYTFSTTINYDFSDINEFGKADIMVYDMMGKIVRSIDLKSNQGSVTLDRSNLPSGVYFYSLVVDGARLKTEKLVVM